MPKSVTPIMPLKTAGRVSAAFRLPHRWPHERDHAEEDSAGKNRGRRGFALTTFCGPYRRIKMRTRGIEPPLP